MNVKSILKKKILKHTNSIGLILKKPTQSFSVENFHQLRVEIKKLKALLKFVNFCSKKNKRKKLFKPFKAIFIQAGKVRELQLEESTLKKYAIYRSLEIYRNELKKELKNEKNIFFGMRNKKFRKKFAKANSVVFPNIKKIHRKDTEEYIKSMRKKIDLFLQNKHLKFTEVHALRKLLKEYYFNNKSLRLQEQNRLVVKTEYILELLGKWHDCIITKGHLEKAEKKIELIDEKEKKQLEKLKINLTADCRMLFRKINRSIQPITSFQY